MEREERLMDRLRLRLLLSEFPEARLALPCTEDSRELAVSPRRRPPPSPLPLPAESEASSLREEVPVPILREQASRATGGEPSALRCGAGEARAAARRRSAAAEEYSALG